MRTAKELCAEAAVKLNLPPNYVWEVYKSYWRAVRAHISSLPLKENLSEEDFAKLQTSINVPSLGKFYIDWGLLNGKKTKHERYSNQKI